MTPPPIRPRFERRIGAEPALVLERVQDALRRAGRGYAVRVLGSHLDVTVDAAERRMWSPCVHIECVPDGATTAVHGLIGPLPSVWTMYALTMLAVATASVFAALLGWSQVLVDEEAWGLWAALGGVAALALLYVGAQAGQRLASDQTEELSSAVFAALESGGERATAPSSI